MSFPMTIPVSMPQHYNSRFFGGGGPTGSPPPGGSANLPPPPPPTAVPASVIASSVSSLMMGPPQSFTTSHMDTRFMMSSASSSSSLSSPTLDSYRTLPSRKQSVFEAPTGLSALRRSAEAASLRLPLGNSPYVTFTSPSPPTTAGGDGSSSLQMNYSHSFTTTASTPSSRHFSASPPDVWSTSSSSSSSGSSNSHLRPLDLSGESGGPTSVITSVASLKVPSTEDISQRISRIIQENQVCLESTEPYSRRHQQSQQHQHSLSHHHLHPSYSLSSKRSMSTTVQPTQSFVPLTPQSVITSLPSSSSLSSSGRTSLGSHHPFGSFGGEAAAVLDAVNRRFSSDVLPANASANLAAAAATLSSYSRLQSALLGEKNKSTEVQQHLLASKVHPGRKFSEIPYQQQAPHPESFKYANLGGNRNESVQYHQQAQHHPVLLNSNHLHHQSPKSVLRPSRDHSHHHHQKHSMIVGINEHLVDVLPALSESSRSNSEPSLVRNLLTSKTSPFAHLVGRGDHFLASSAATSLSSSSTGTSSSDSSIIKDLLLRSRHSSVIDQSQMALPSSTSTTTTRSTPPPNKRNRTESANFDLEKYVCPLCQIPFRNRQNLEVHQRVYCRGGSAGSSSTVDGSFKSNPSFDDQLSNPNDPGNRLGAKRSYQELGHAPPIPLRKVSVLERPSIITYNASGDFHPLHQQHTLPFSSLSTVSINSSRQSSTSSDHPHQQFSANEKGVKDEGDGDDEEEDEDEDDEEEKEGSFGNILKSKLLSRDDSYANMIPLKKRKISEPAFRYHDAKHRDSFIRPHRLSIMQPPVLSRQERSTGPQLEILPAYMPYLQSASVKITIKSPVLFPVLQDLLDTGTNHEFIVDNSQNSSCLSTSTFAIPLVNLDDEEAEELERQKAITQLADEAVFCLNQSENNLVNYDGKTQSQSSSLEDEVKETIDSLLDRVVSNLSEPIVSTSTLTTTTISPAVKKTSPARPTSLSISQAHIPSYEQSARNERELISDDLTSSTSRKTSQLSIFVNRVSNEEDEESLTNLTSTSRKHSKSNHLIASTLVSPDTPRAKRKYQQLHINGHAYTNLGLKVNPRPTYCCLYRLQPMFVTQEANPQLSMYSQWKTAPLPPGDILGLGGDPRALLGAYNSAEAVFEASRSRLSLVEVVTAATMGGLETAAASETEEEKVVSEEEAGLPEIVKPTGTVSREFLDRVAVRLANYLSGSSQQTAVGHSLPDKLQLSSSTNSRAFERTFQSVIISLGAGFVNRLADTCARSQYILTHSSYHRLASQARAALSQQTRAARKRSRTHAVDFAARLALTAPGRSITSAASSSSAATEMAIAATGSNISNAYTNSQYLSLAEQASRLPLSEGNSSNSSLKLPELSSSSVVLKPRKRSSTSSLVQSASATSLSSSTFSPFLTMHPMLGHLPARSKQTVMYIMMMGQAPLSSSVPTLGSLATSKSMASRKFSECIGMKAMASSIEAEAAWAASNVGGMTTGVSEMIPKRIKIFEGGFKSNEDYTYVRGRGRGKYVCEECGIRCKKPSMLKKHIRTHTDLRPYSCRHCAFAFKTKGNLTKHMKSKAHHKKCVELGIIPVPTSIDDSQIDSDALAKQEQWELSCGGSSGGLHQFADDDEEDCDEDYDEEEYEEEDEEEDEGVPIPLIEQQRLTYIVPGQFDDAESGNNSHQTATEQAKTPRSHKNSDCSSSTLSATSYSPRQKLSISSATGVSVASCSTPANSNTTVPLSSGASTLPLSITDIRSAASEENADKHAGISNNHRKVSSSSRGSNHSVSTALSPSSLQLSSSSSSKMQQLSSASPSAHELQQQLNNQQIANNNTNQQAATCGLQSYHFGQSVISVSSDANKAGRMHWQQTNQQHSTGGTISNSSPPPAPTSSSQQKSHITKENEAEAARSLLILSGISAHSNTSSTTESGNRAQTSASLLVHSGPADSGENATVQKRLAYSKRKTSGAENSSRTMTAETMQQQMRPPSSSAQDSRRISYEVASDHVLLASPSQQQQQFQLHQQILQQQQTMGSTEHNNRHSPIEMMRRISASMPGAAGYSGPLNPSPPAKVDRRTSQPTSVIITNNNGLNRVSPVSSDHPNVTGLEAAYEEALWKRSRHERSISESSAYGLPAHGHQQHPFAAGISPLATSSGSAHHFQQYANSLQGALRNPRAALIAEEIKRAANGETLQQQQQQQQVQHHQQQISAHLHQLQQLQQASRMASIINNNPAQEQSPPFTHQQSNGSAPQGHPQPQIPVLAAAMDPNSQMIMQQNLLAKIYETFKQQQQQTPSSVANLKQQQLFAGFPGLTSADLAKAQQQLLSTPLAINSALINGSSSQQLKVPSAQQSSLSPNLSYLVPPTSTSTKKETHSRSRKSPSLSSYSGAQEGGSLRQSKVPSPSSRVTFAPVSASQVPLPPPPASPRPAPSVGLGKAEGAVDDMPMDLSKSSSTTLAVPSEVTSIRGVSPTAELATTSRRSPNVATIVQQQTPSPPAKTMTPPGLSGSQQLVAAAVTAAQQLQSSSPNRQHPHHQQQQHRFRPMMEEKLLTEQLVRAFSPLNELHQISLPRAGHSPQSGREAYKNIRSEEFAHLTPGVHTPHRLPQNMLLMGARSNGAVLVSPNATSTATASPGPSSSSSGPVARAPNSIPNAYTNAEGKSVCTICMKQFSKPSQLRLHINIHFFERPFRCDSCAVSFRTKGHLQKHSRSVSHLNKLNMNITFGRPSTDNPRPFKCSDCKIAFRIHGHLAKHLRSKMHIMKLECLGKLPFGMFAEMERSNINLTPIDTTDCEKALESLRSLAQKLYDPRQMTWQVMEQPSAEDDGCIEEELMMDEDFEEGDEEDDDEGMLGYPDAPSELEMSSSSSSATALTATSTTSASSPPEVVASGHLGVSVSPSPPTIVSPTPQPLASGTSSLATTSTSSSNGGIASTRSNTCHLCGRTFKAAKFLQVHLYCDHPTESAAAAAAAFD